MHKTVASPGQEDHARSPQEQQKNPLRHAGRVNGRFIFFDAEESVGLQQMFGHEAAACGFAMRRSANVLTVCMRLLSAGAGLTGATSRLLRKIAAGHIW